MLWWWWHEIWIWKFQLHCTTTLTAEQHIHIQPLCSVISSDECFFFLLLFIISRIIIIVVIPYVIVVFGQDRRFTSMVVCILAIIFSTHKYAMPHFDKWRLTLFAMIFPLWLLFCHSICTESRIHPFLVAKWLMVWPSFMFIAPTERRICHFGRSREKLCEKRIAHCKPQPQYDD